jgi:hypothetical protein
MTGHETERVFCVQHEVIMGEIKELRKRPSWAVLCIVSFLSVIATTFVSLYFSSNSTIFIVAGKQQIVLSRLDSLEVKVELVQKQAAENAIMLQTILKAKISGYN